MLIYAKGAICNLKTIPSLHYNYILHDGSWSMESRSRIFGTMRPLATLTLLLCLWVSCYVLGSISSAGPAGKPTRPKLVPRSPLPKNHRSQESQEFRMEKYSSSSILTARAAQRVLDKTQAPNDRSVLERLKCDPRRYPGPGRQWLMLWF